MSPAGSAQAKTKLERFSALAVNMDRGTSGPVETVVNRSSTERERDRLMQTLK
jgi:hypothetical protein